METILIIIVGIITNILIICATYLGFKMGRVTKEESMTVFAPKDMGDKDALNTPDIFSEEINDEGVE